MKKKLSLLAVIMMVELLTACAIRPTYEATVQSPNDGALVTGWMQLLPFMKVVVIGVDGYFRRGWDAWTTAPLLIDPGIRTLEVYGMYFGFFVLPYKAEAIVELKADLQAGQTYELKIERKERLLTFWLENAATHEVMCERLTTEVGSIPIIGGPGGFY